MRPPGSNVAASAVTSPDSASVLVVEDDDSIATQIMALDAGADDYLVKPFGLGELQARIRAALRRARPEGEVVRYGPLVVDLRTHRVTVNDQEIQLTPKEFDILECLTADPGRVVSRQEIMETAWDAHVPPHLGRARTALAGAGAPDSRTTRC